MLDSEIIYGINMWKEVWSKRGSEVVYPTVEGDIFYLNKSTIFDMFSFMSKIKWHIKIPKAIKALHEQAWASLA